MLLNEDQRQMLNNAALCYGFLNKADEEFIAGLSAKKDMFRFRYVELSYDQNQWLEDINIKLQEVGAGHRYAMQCASANV